MYKVKKRNGKTENFNGDKIVLAIKKGFESILDEVDAADVNRVYLAVNEELEQTYKPDANIKIEDIQNLIEKKLGELGYEEVHNSFAEYREKRRVSREIFEKRQHKFTKALEELSLKEAEEVDSKRDNANVDGNTAMGTMLQYGATIAKEFAKSYLMKKEYSDAHDAGAIHIHDMDFQPMGTTTCCQIDLFDLFKNGFSTGHGFLREPGSITSYASLAAIAIQSNQNDQHGGQSIPALDYFLAPGVLKTFKKELKSLIHDMLELGGYLNFINFKKLTKEIDTIETIDFDISILDKYAKESIPILRLFRFAKEKALVRTEKMAHQAMEAFIHNLNTMHSRAGAQVPFSSVNLGTDTSSEGRMVTRNYLKAANEGLGKGETPIFPISVFKIKEGINYNPKDPNYDLFRQAMEVSAKRLFPNFSFIDAPFNIKTYKKGDYRTEVGYMGCRTRVFANVVNEEKAITPGRGNLSFTSINLVRIALKHGLVNNKKADIKAFYKELDEMMELVKNQQLERFKYQGQKKVKNFPFLMGQGIWMDSAKLKPNDKIKRVLVHGTLSMGFIGLAETLKCLIGKHHGESDEAQKLGLEIINHMRKNCDKFAKEYNLNFTLLATPAEGLAGRFTNIDKSIYGELSGITDREYYTNSFHVPVHHKISIEKKIKIEAPYHALTNAGHITYVELEGHPSDNIKSFEKIIRLMKESGVGYGAINHPVDRDPVCGFTGVIADKCPSCGRIEKDGIPFDRIRRITGYLVGTVDRFNNGKRAEERDRVKHKEN